MVALLTALPSVSEASSICGGPSADSRLQVFCISKTFVLTPTDVETVRAIDFRLKSEGYPRGLGLPGRVEETRLSFFLAPIFEYSPNINGGNPDKPLVLGSLTFEGDPALMRKSGTVFGAGLGFSGRSIYGRGSYFDYNLGVSHAHAPEHDLGISRIFGGLCSKNDVGGNVYLDGCLDANLVQRDIDDDAVGTATASLRYLLDSGGQGFYFPSIGVRRVFDDEYVQNQLLLSMEAVSASSWRAAIAASFGEGVRDVFARRQSVSFQAGTTLYERAISVSLEYSYSDGSRILGFPRSDVASSFSVSYAVHDNFSLSVGYRNVDSSIDYFDESGIIFGIQLSPIQF